MLEKYKEHKRLRVFYNKGTECVNPLCNKKGTMLVHGEDRGGRIHIDVCDDDFYPMSVDHRIPKSKGGSDDLDNLDPMCTGCNTKKGNGDNKHSASKERFKLHNTPGYKRITKNLEIGDTVYKNSTDKELGRIVEIKPNHRHPQSIMSAVIEGRDEESLYALRSLYKIERIEEENIAI